MNKLIVRINKNRGRGRPFGSGKQSGNHKSRKKFVYFKGDAVGTFQGNKYAAPLACRIWHRTILAKELNNLQKNGYQVYSTDIIGAALYMFHKANKATKLKYLEKEVCFRHKILKGL